MECWGADNVDLILDFDVLRSAGAILGSGGIIAADEDTCVVDLTRALVAFCQYESCGKCFPCRMGMSHLLEVLERICDLKGEPEDLDLMRRDRREHAGRFSLRARPAWFQPRIVRLSGISLESLKITSSSHTCPTDVCNGPRYSPARSRR